MDMAIARAMFNRVGLRMTHLTGRMSKAFEVFSEHGVSTLFVRLPGNNYSRMSQLEDSLDIVSRFDNAVSQNKPIIYTRKGKRKIVLPVRDENGVPDPNLTLVAALNGLSPESMKRCSTFCGIF